MRKVSLLLIVTLLLGSIMTPITAGAVEAAAVTTRIESASLSLEDRVFIWFDMSISGATFAESDYGMIFWSAEQSAGQYTYENAQASAQARILTKAEGELLYDSTLKKDVVSFKHGVAAKQMIDMVYAQAYVRTADGYAYSQLVPYSVQTYAANKLGLNPNATPTTDEKLKTLLRDMLDYGASAQIYFGYKTDNLANAILNAPVSTAPTITVSSASARAGDTRVTVVVSLESNPGFLTLALSIDYDADALTLTKVSCGSDYTDYTFTKPKDLSSGCKASWFSTDLPEEIIDGDIMILQFTVNSSAANGQHAITVSCPDDGGTVDGNREVIDLRANTGYITVN